MSQHDTAGLDDSLPAWRDLTDPRRAREVDDLEQGLKEPVFENLEIPEHLGPVDVLIDDHKIKRYAFTHDDYLPWALDTSPFDGQRIGHAALLGNDLVQLFTTRYRASRTVGLHTEEQMWFDSPARMGQTVRLEGSYVESYSSRGQDYVVMEASARTPEGRSVVRHRGVEILRTVPGKVAGRASAPAGTARVSGEVDPAARRVSVLDASVRVGDVLEPMHREITQEQASVFSRIGEYVRNVHDDLDIARANNLRIPIVQGQQQFGLLATLLTRAFGAAFFTSGWIRAKFIQPVEVFEPLEISGTVTKVEPVEGGLACSLDVWARRADGKLSTIGWARAIVPTH
ncbi:MAG: hypothetical protein ACK5KU_01385 [Beutenbergiaceae bacterium]